MKKLIVSFSIILTVFIVILPYTNILDNLIWRMPSSPLDKHGYNIAERLGYPKDAKLLIINSDDTGANPTFTHGIEQVMRHGLVKSNSIIVHDRNDAELNRIAEISKANPDWGFGVHLMLTNEYQHGYPWAPVLSQESVPSLYNDKALSWEKISEVEDHVNPAEALLEFKAQVQKAIDAGIDVTHIDSHMGTYYRQSNFPAASADGLIQAAISTAKHFNIPITINTFDKKLEAAIRQVDAENIIRPDTFFGFYELEDMNSHLSYTGSVIQKTITAWVVKQVFGFELPYENRKLTINDVHDRMSIYKMAIKNVAKPGLNQFFIHAAEEREDGDVIPSGLNHASGVDHIVRLGDSAVWSSDEMKNFLIEENIILINFTQLKLLMQPQAVSQSHQ